MNASERRAAKEFLSAHLPTWEAGVSQDDGVYLLFAARRDATVRAATITVSCAIGPEAAKALVQLAKRIDRGDGLVQTTVAQATLAPTASPPSPARAGVATTREHAQMAGFTGDACPTCGAMMLVRNGTCLKCVACGGTTGCS